MTSMTTQRRDASRAAGSSARPGFGNIVRAEWIKFRSVRGWLIGLTVGGLLTLLIGVFAAANGSIGCQKGPSGPVETGRACTPKVPVGPGGEAVSDSYYIAGKPLSGNGSITVQVTSLTGLHASGNGLAASQSPLAGMRSGIVPWAKGGIIISASTRPGSAYAAMMVTGDHGVRMQYDYTSDIAGLPGTATTTSPRWLRLTRRGDTIRGYDSADGTRWTLVGTAELSGLRGTVQAGMFATSPIYAKLTPFFGGASAISGPSQATAIFDDVQLHGNWTAGAWRGQIIGGRAASPGTGFGYLHHTGSTFSVSGSGDIAPVVPGAAAGFPTTTFEQPLTGIFVGLIAIAVVGAAFFTSEYRRGLIRTTLAASPRRGRVLTAKALVIGSVAFAVGLVTSVASVALGLPRESNQGMLVLPVSLLTEVRVLLGCAALVALGAILAIALGAILRRGAAAVTASIVVIVLPFVLSVTVLPAGVANWVLRLTPAAGFAVLQSIPDYSFVSKVYSPAQGSYPLPPWGGFAVLCAYTAAALSLATFLLRRRDA
jgi:ABC-type transport system involved in multi-copper enzyme maturation permease subunit